MTRTTQADVVVAGAGPAGLALAGALAETGLDVIRVSPGPLAWTPTYCCFHDELEGLGLERFAANQWARPLVYSGFGDPLVLPRSYARIDNDGLADHLASVARDAGCAELDGRVASAEPHEGGVRLTLEDGTSLGCRLVVDATGRGLRGRTAGHGRVNQVALGRVVEVDHVPWAADEAVWMDFRDVPDGERPSFLYALPLGQGRILLEETSLACAPAVPLALLGRRLDGRIAKLGLRVRRTIAEERVHIALDAPVEAPIGRVLPFGAAAGFVHPATGYSVIRSLRRAQPVARAISESIEAGPDAAVLAGHRAAWSTRDRVVRALHDAGLQVLLGLDAAHTRRFFAAFFSLPAELQRAWLDPTGQPTAVAHAMASLFGRAPWAVRSDIFFGALENLGSPLRRPESTGGST